MNKNRAFLICVNSQYLNCETKTSLFSRFLANLSRFLFLANFSHFFCRFLDDFSQFWPTFSQGNAGISLTKLRQENLRLNFRSILQDFPVGGSPGPAKGGWSPPNLNWRTKNQRKTSPKILLCYFKTERRRREGEHRRGEGSETFLERKWVLRRFPEVSYKPFFLLKTCLEQRKTPS